MVYVSVPMAPVKVAVPYLPCRITGSAKEGAHGGDVGGYEADLRFHHIPSCGGRICERKVFDVYTNGCDETDYASEADAGKMLAVHSKYEVEIDVGREGKGEGSCAHKPPIRNTNDSSILRRWVIWSCQISGIGIK